jgi:F0F1-type ATP synthase membrane subunit b/b'
VSPTLTTLLFEAANFLVLAAVLSWLFFRPVSESLENRRVKQRQQADDAADKLAEAERVRSEIEHKYATLDQELEHRRTKSRAAAEQQAALILQQARESARRESDAAKIQLGHLQRSQRERLARIIAETAAVSIERLLIQIDQPQLRHFLTAAAAREIRSLEGNSLAPVRIESAHPLDQVDRDALSDALGAAGESAEFHVIEELGMGLRVSTNRGLIDVSSAGLANFAERQLANQLATSEELAGEQSCDG